MEIWQRWRDDLDGGRSLSRYRILLLKYLVYNKLVCNFASLFRAKYALSAP